MKDTIYDNPSLLYAHSSGIFPVRRIEKPWGAEELLACTDKYVMKFLHIKKGHRFSVQYHERKEETMYCLEGKCVIELRQLDSEKIEWIQLEPGASVHITPYTVHAVEALTDVTLIEASTPELDDVVRLEDRYGRTP